MYSKNNVKMNAEKKAVKSPKYGLAKLSVGVASVLLGTTLVYGANAQADTKTMVQPTPATEGALASSAAPASSAAQSATVTSEDVQKASDAASAAQATADAHKQAVSDAQAALDKAKAANSDAAAVKDALNNAKSAEAAQSAAESASVSAYEEQSAADKAVADAKTAAYPGWEKDYNNFIEASKDNAKKLADAKATEAKAQTQVDQLTNAVKGQDAVIAQQTAAIADAEDELAALPVKSGSKYDAAVAKLNAAKAARGAAEAQKASYVASLADWKNRLDAAKVATEDAQAAVDYDNGLYKLNDHDAKIMAAKKAANELPTLELKAKVAKANHDAKYAQYQNAVEATKAAKAAYEQAKLDHNLPSSAQLKELEKAAQNTKSDQDAAQTALDDAKAEAGVTAAETAIKNLTDGMKNDDKTIAANQAALDDLQAQLDAAKKDLADAEATLATDKDNAVATINKATAQAKINVLEPQLRQAKITLKKSQNVKDLHQDQLNRQQQALATAKAKPAYVKALNNFNAKKAAADKAATALNAATTNLDATKDARKALNDAQDTYDAAVQKQAELDKAAANAKAAYEELYAKLNNGEKPTDDNTNKGDDTKTDDNTNKGDDTKTDNNTNKGDDTKTDDNTNKGDDTKTDDNTNKGDNGSADANKNANDQKDDANKGASDVTLKGANGKTAQVKLAASKAATKSAVKAAAQLPQTGNESAVAATGLGVAALVGMLGLAGASKRRA